MGHVLPSPAPPQAFPSVLPVHHPQNMLDWLHHKHSYPGHCKGHWYWAQAPQDTAVLDWTCLEDGKPPLAKVPIVWWTAHGLLQRKCTMEEIEETLTSCGINYWQWAMQAADWETRWWTRHQATSLFHLYEFELLVGGILIRNLDHLQYSNNVYLSVGKYIYLLSHYLAHVLFHLLSLVCLFPVSPLLQNTLFSLICWWMFLILIVWCRKGYFLKIRTIFFSVVKLLPVCNMASSGLWKMLTYII